MWWNVTWKVINPAHNRSGQKRIFKKKKTSFPTTQGLRVSKDIQHKDIITSRNKTDTFFIPCILVIISIDGTHPVFLSFCPLVSSLPLFHFLCFPACLLVISLSAPFWRCTVIQMPVALTSLSSCLLASSACISSRKDDDTRTQECTNWEIRRGLIIQSTTFSFARGKKGGTCWILKLGNRKQCYDVGWRETEGSHTKLVLTSLTVSTRKKNSRSISTKSSNLFFLFKSIYTGQNHENAPSPSFYQVSEKNIL